MWTLGPELQHSVAQACLVGVRVGMLMVFAPFFGSASVPMRVKAGLTVALTALLYPAYGPGAHPAHAIDWFRVVMTETVVGLLLGLTWQFVFEGVQLAGQLLGFQFGFSLVNVIDPQSQVDTPVLSVFHQAVAFLIFLQLDVHHWILRGLAKSFEYLPPGSASATQATTEEFLRVAGGLLLVGVQVAMPALAATLLADIALGLLGKASPQLPVLFVGLSVKGVLGLVVLVGAVAYWPRQLEAYFLGSIASAERLLHLAR